jgi:Zn-dependent metalloprotease
VDQWNTPLGDATRRGTDTAAVKWLVGENIPGGASRNMMNPNAFADPGKTSDTQYSCSWEDNGGVHTNSGVPRLRLSVDGGT